MIFLKKFDSTAKTEWAYQLKLRNWFTKSFLSKNVYKIRPSRSFSPVEEKHNVIYHSKCHCDSYYCVGRTTQKFHIRRDQNVTKSLRNWLLNGSETPGNSPSTIAEHLLYNPECAKHYEDKMFSILAIGRNSYHCSVLESLYIKTLKSKLCKQQFVYNSRLYKLL